MTEFAPLARLERFNVVGTSGSGKTTFARRLAALLDLPFCEMDQLFWRPGWQGAPDEEFIRRVAEFTAGPRWVLDGNYTRTIPAKWKQVQAVIWLDLSLARTVFQVRPAGHSTFVLAAGDLARDGQLRDAGQDLPVAGVDHLVEPHHAPEKSAEIPRLDEFARQRSLPLRPTGLARPRRALP